MAAKKSAKRAQPGATKRHDHGHDEHDHVEFMLSKKTAGAIDRALKGLTEPQQRRVLEAVDRVGEEAGETVGRWVEENVVANSNELLALLLPDMASSAQWSEIRAIFQFLGHLDLPVDQARMAEEIKKAHGAKVAGEYKKQVGRRRRK